MAKAIFDNLMKMIKEDGVIATTTVQSVEIDLELPRGYVAKIKKVVMEFADLAVLIEGLAADDSESYQCALLRDPDDIVTVTTPVNSVEHDVIVEWHPNWGLAFGTAENSFMFGLFHRQWTFDQELDVVTARNLRFNIVGAGGSTLTPRIVVQIWYTLERIRDTQILELLDIL